MESLTHLSSYKYRRALLNSLPVWESDATFKALMDSIEYTAVTWPRCYLLYTLAQNSLSLSGEVAEVGVYRGGSARILTAVNAQANKVVNLFDTFEGMPDIDETIDMHHKGDFNDTSVEIVKNQLVDLTNYKIHKGFFPDSAKGINFDTFSMVHIDVDIYTSVLDCCRFFYPKLVSGGIMIFDDYGEPTCPGAKKAVDEYFSSKIEAPIYIPTGQCLIIKLPV